jgi:hypothetical protein
MRLSFNRLMYFGLSESVCILLKMNFHGFWDSFIFVILLLQKCLGPNMRVTWNIGSDINGDFTGPI